MGLMAMKSKNIQKCRNKPIKKIQDQVVSI